MGNILILQMGVEIDTIQYFYCLEKVKILCANILALMDAHFMAG